MIQHTSPISGVDTFGDLVATAGYDNRVLLWNRRTGHVLARGWHDHLANQCRFSPDGRYLVTAGSDHTARVWTVPQLSLRAVCADHDDDVEMASFAPGGDRIATASRDCCARIFDRDGALELVLRGHTKAVLSVEWTGDGTEVVTSSDDGTVRRWSAIDGRELRCFGFDGTETDTLVITPDDTVIAGNDDGEIIVGLGTGSAGTHRGHHAGIKRLALSSDGRRLASAGYDQRLVIWSLTGSDARPETCVDIPHSVWARTMAFTDDGDLIFGSFGSSFARFDPTDSSWHVDHISPTHGLNAVSFGLAGLATIGDAGVLRVDGHAGPTLGSLCNFIVEWDGRQIVGGHAGEVIDGLTGERLHAAGAPLNCATLAPDGRLVVGVYTGQGLVFSSGVDGVTLEATLVLGDQAVKGVAASADRLFAIDAAGGARCFDWPSQQLVFDDPAGHDSIANDVCALPDGRFATVSRDLSLRLWADGRAERHPAPLRHSLKCVAADRTGGSVAIGAYDGSVAVFDVSERRFRWWRRLTTAGISDLVAGSVPNEFWASSYDGRAYCFDAELTTITEVAPSLPCSG